ncbi:hypothetical protein [Necropsobacter massiliensis]|uniref:hypothetical protein n=1 Tax=Necropsobacter massiliensis TaxID=1400001 RepID=UPI0005963705|nr:hypothetical protein [Necropsobacter massiliensis]
MLNQRIDQFQFNLLKSEVSNLEEVNVLLNLLFTHTDLDSVDSCEMELALKGINRLLEDGIAEINHRIAFMLGEEVK